MFVYKCTYDTCLFDINLVYSLPTFARCPQAFSITGSSARPSTGPINPSDTPASHGLFALYRRSAQKREPQMAKRGTPLNFVRPAMAPPPHARTERQWHHNSVFAPPAHILSHKSCAAIHHVLVLTIQHSTRIFPPRRFQASNDGQAHRVAFASSPPGMPASAAAGLGAGLTPASASATGAVARKVGIGIMSRPSSSQRGARAGNDQGRGAGVVKRSDGGGIKKSQLIFVGTGSSMAVPR